MYKGCRRTSYSSLVVLSALEVVQRHVEPIDWLFLLMALEAQEASIRPINITYLSEHSIILADSAISEWFLGSMYFVLRMLVRE